jgi:DNA-directed RNA polymerase subunit L
MELNILRDEKEEIEIKIDNLTIAELLRVYLNKDSGVTFAAWKRGHVTENPVLLVKTKGKIAKKAVSDAVSQIIKELNKIETNFKKLK